MRCAIASSVEPRSSGLFGMAGWNQLNAGRNAHVVTSPWPASRATMAGNPSGKVTAGTGSAALSDSRVVDPNTGNGGSLSEGPVTDTIFTMLAGLANGRSCLMNSTLLSGGDV